MAKIFEKSGWWCKNFEISCKFDKLSGIERYIYLDYKQKGAKDADFSIYLKNFNPKAFIEYCASDQLRSVNPGGAHLCKE